MHPLDTYLAFVRATALVTAVLITVFSIDDLVVDVTFWVRAAYRRLVIRPRYPALAVTALYEKPEQTIAIMIPAWREDDVIAAMIENTISSLNYKDYCIFVGTYVNDPDTIAEVERMRRRYRRVIRVEIPRAGPTCKADCLNVMVNAIFQLETETGCTFAGIVLHDSEDVLHPLELKFFNYLLPRKDLIQLPVVSLERRYRELIAGTYMDEFAEWHAKDLVVREALAGAVPSAGVGTAFSRRAMLTLIEHNAQEPFNTQSLTEDYDIGARLAAEGLPSIMAHYSVEFRVHRKTLFGFGREKEIGLRMPLCVREFFPNTFKTSYRQKARWTLGISLQGWAQLGWTHSFWGNYFLVRDRKALLAPTIALLSYFVLANFLIFGAWAWFFGLAGDPVPHRTWFNILLWFNAAALTTRIVQRFIFVNRIYGWEHGLLSPARLVVASFVNFAATMRAVRIYFSSLIFGTPIVWDKTMHEFPTSKDLGRDHRTLGEILVQWEAVTPSEIEAAMAEQRQSKQRIGRILLAKGWLDDETLAEAIAIQSGLKRVSPTREILERLGGMIPYTLCVHLRILPAGLTETGALVVAATGPLTPEQLAEVSDVAGQEVIQRIAREGVVNAGLRFLAGERTHFEETQSVPLLGDILIDHGHISRDVFEDALKTYRPDQDGRIGDLLLSRGVITPHALAEAISAQRQLLNAFQAQQLAQ